MSPRLRAPEPVETPPDPPRPTGKLLRIEDVADVLAVSRSMAWKLVTNGDIRSIRIGRAVRIRRYDVDDYIEQQSGFR